MVVRLCSDTLSHLIAVTFIKIYSITEPVIFKLSCFVNGDKQVLTNGPWEIEHQKLIKAKTNKSKKPISQTRRKVTNA